MSRSARRHDITPIRAYRWQRELARPVLRTTTIPAAEATFAEVQVAALVLREPTATTISSLSFQFQDQLALLAPELRPNKLDRNCLRPHLYLSLANYDPNHARQSDHWLSELGRQRTLSQHSDILFYM